MKIARIFISGFVHDVGFRHFVRSKGKELGLTGFARNLPDGRVEVMAQGSPENLEQLIKDCRKGPMLAEVESVEVVWEENKENYTSFEILT